MKFGKPHDDWSDGMRKPKRTPAERRADKRARMSKKESVRNRFRKIKIDEQRSGRADALEIAKIEAEMAMMELDPKNKERKSEMKDTRKQARDKKAEYGKNLTARLAKPSDGNGMIAEFVKPGAPVAKEDDATEEVAAGSKPKDYSDDVTLGSALDAGGITMEDSPTINKMTPKEAAQAHRIAVEEADLAEIDKIMASLQALKELPEEIDGVYGSEVDQINARKEEILNGIGVATMGLEEAESSEEDGSADIDPRPQPEMDRP